MRILICSMLLLGAQCIYSQFTTNFSQRYNGLGVHPGYTMISVRPNGFEANTGGVDTLSGGRLVVATLQEVKSTNWPNAAGSIVKRAGLFVLNGFDTRDKTKITVDTIALTMEDFTDGKVDRGNVTHDEPLASEYTPVYQRWATGHNLNYPAGVWVINDTIYVMELRNLSRFVDINNNGKYQQKDTVAHIPFGGGYWELPHSPLRKDGKWWYAKCTAVVHGGQRDTQHSKFNGAVNSIDASGTIEEIASGLRCPSGIGLGPSDEIFVADNQGIYNVPDEIHHVKKGRFFGHHLTAESQTATYGQAAQSPTTIMMPHIDLARSIGDMFTFDQGPYKGQLFVGDEAMGAAKRVFLEMVDGEWQGAAFAFTGGFEAGSFRPRKLPNGEILIGEMGACCRNRAANWDGKTQGLDLMTPKDTVIFDLLAVRTRANGMELEFTLPLESGGEAAANYVVKRWTYRSTPSYGGGKMGQETLNIGAVQINNSRTKVFLQVPQELNPNFATDNYHYQYYIGVDHGLKSQDGKSLWTTDAWYSLNYLSTAQPFEIVGCNNPAYKEYDPNTTVADARMCLTSIPQQERIFEDRIQIHSNRGLIIDIGEKKSFEVVLRDIEGKMIFQKSAIGELEYRQPLEKGLYLIQVNLGSQSYYKKWLKNY